MLTMMMMILDEIHATHRHAAAKLNIQFINIGWNSRTSKQNYKIKTKVTFGTWNVYSITKINNFFLLKIEKKKKKKLNEIALQKPFEVLDPYDILWHQGFSIPPSIPNKNYSYFLIKYSFHVSSET